MVCSENLLLSMCFCCLMLVGFSPPKNYHSLLIVIDYFGAYGVSGEVEVGSPLLPLPGYPYPSEHLLYFTFPVGLYM